MSPRILIAGCIAFLLALIVVLSIVRSHQPVTPGIATGQIGPDEFIDAAEEGDDALVRRYIAAGGDVNVGFRSRLPDAGKTALHVASIRGHHSVIRSLIEAHADLNARDAELETPLMYATGGEAGSASIVEALVAAGADPNLRNRSGWTALMIAANLGSLAEVRILLRAGADPRISDPAGNTALHLAGRSFSADWRAVAEALVEAGADPDLPNAAGLRFKDYAREQEKGKRKKS